MAQNRHITIICVTVASLNGKTTNGDDPTIYTWTSKEDQEQFFRLIEHAELILMGRKTYEHARHLMKHTKGRLRIVLTSHPENFASDAIPNQLEFSSENPKVLVKKLADRGFSQALLVGGSHTNTAFLTKNLIDELWLTIEPVIFPTGTPLFTEGVHTQKLKLLSIEKLNSQGTLLAKYKSIH